MAIDIFSIAFIYNVSRSLPSWDFPGGAVVKNPPANAEGHGFHPWSRKIPRAAEQLSP